MINIAYIIVSSLIILFIGLFVVMSLYKKPLPHYLVFFFFGLGIGPLLYNFGIEFSIAGLRIESWIWLGVLISLVLGVFSFNKLNRSFELVLNSYYFFIFIYLVLIFLNIFRSPMLSDGVGMFLIKSFIMFAACNFYANNFDYIQYEKLVYFSVAICVITTVIYSILGYPIVQFDYTGTPRLTGSMGWASLAYFLIVPFNVFLVNYIVKRDKKSLFLMSLLMGLILLTVSRTGMLMLLLILIGVISTLKRGKFVFIYLFGGVILLSLPFVYNMLYRRFFYSTSSYVSGIATSGRLTSAEYLIENYMNSLNSWFFGNGSGFAKSSLDDLEKFGIQRIHSSLIESLIDLGFLGPFFLLLFVIFFLFRFWFFCRNFDNTTSLSKHIEEYKSLLIGLSSSIMLLPLIVLENLYNPFHLAVMSIGISLGYRNLLKVKRIKKESDLMKA